MPPKSALAVLAHFLGPQATVPDRRSDPVVRKTKRRFALRGREDKQRQTLAVQCAQYRKDGHARTEDHVMLLPGQTRQRQKGTGTRKRWTPEAVLRAGFAPPTEKARHTGIDGAGHAQALDSRITRAQAVEHQQEQGLKRLRDAAETEDLAFFISTTCLTRRNSLCDAARTGERACARCWLPTAR